MTDALYNEHGTPLSKHPDCPNCGEDEIGSHFDNAWCHACGTRWSLRVLRALAAERAARPEVRVEYP